MHLASGGNFIFMLLFWLGSYLLTIWLMSCLFPAAPAKKDKKHLKSESRQANSSMADRRMWSASSNRVCPTPDSVANKSKRVERGTVMPLLDHKYDKGG